jgi:hypothetical protein
MLIHRKNVYAPRDKQRIGWCEAQSHEPVNKVKNLFVCALPLSPFLNITLKNDKTFVPLACTSS